MALFSLALGLTLLTALLLHLDDLFLDLYNLVKRVRPRALSPREVRRLKGMPQRKIALLIPCWKEAEILERMVRGNLDSIEYSNYSVFLGLYPNDYPSWRAARNLERDFPELQLILNDRHGPTSKAQLLNEMVRQILLSEENTGLSHEIFLLHDAEDVIHPLSFCLLNEEMEKADLVQLPVLSQPLSWKAFTAGTYADESAETHMRDYPAREALGALAPVSGAGTALSRTLLRSLLCKGRFLTEEEAAENYHLGLEAGRLGFRSRFVGAFRLQSGRRDFVATRKFFPEKTESAIRHKARSTTGIAFQGAQRFGWKGGLIDRYFFWRDRRGPWTTILLAFASSLFLVSAFQSDGEPPILPRWIELLSLVNGLFWLRRVLWRMRTTAWVHGWAYALLVPFRWPVANLINSLSTWRALSLWRGSLRSGKAPAWSGRERRLPEGFGEASRSGRLGPGLRQTF